MQATILDPATGKLSVYAPLVITQGTQPAIPPTVPTLPANAVVGISFGFNGNNLTLVDNQGSLAQGRCENGQPTIFGQVSFCNNTAFFQAANQAIQAGLLKVPALGTARDGQTCPTVRDFSVVDQDQSDNVTSNYLVSGNRLAQDTTANRTTLPNAVPLSNGSDNALIDVFIDPTLGCQSWTAPDLADPQGQMVTSQHLDELQAAAYQQNPIALIPALDPMVLVNKQPNLAKVNLYRMGVDQPEAMTLADADTTMYCMNFLQVGLPRLAKDKQLTLNAKTPDAQMATNLFTFLANRYSTTYTMLTCKQLLGVKNPVTVQMQNNVATSAQINLNAISVNQGTGTIPTPVPTTGTAPTPTPVPNTGVVPTPTPVPNTGTVPIIPTSTPGTGVVPTPTPATCPPLTTTPDPGTLLITPTPVPGRDQQHYSSVGASPP